MMMARPYVVAAVCVALWCGVAFGQEAQPADDAQDNKADTDPATGQQPNEATESKTMSTASTTTTTTERTNAAGGDEASPSMDKKNGAATMSVSLSSLMIATVLAKMYAH